ncbi:aspartic peptidase domain-containing protein [Gigaspora rosea]|uniref:Aspartic peptidase domain-containing protein n=1 Tax=Gigaspora rosea TaxID=44941 RepID=A0A397W169_9GLOM|nr:aspartic peptidase domain-containing protein [Gigaspora rosea]
MRALHIFTFAIAIFLYVDALPYDKPKVHTIPLKLRSITRRRISKRAKVSMPLKHDKGYYGQITFGTGTPQNFDILFDTGSGALFVMGKNCGSPACNNKPKYDPDVDRSFNLIEKGDFEIDYASGLEIRGDSGKTTIVIAGISVEAQKFGVADKVSDNYDRPLEGVMGMELIDISGNQQITPITNLINNKQLDKPQFSFLLGREADQSPSELTIGGSNPDRYHAHTLTFVKLVDDNKGQWEIPIDDLAINGEGTDLEDRTGFIDTGTERIVMPPDDAHKFYFNYIDDAEDNGDGTYKLDCNATYKVALVFKGVAWKIDPRDFTVELDKDICIGAIIYDDNVPELKWVIGSAFLRNVYTIFDQGNRKIGFAQLAKNND